jgi:hypothetical protein
MRFLATMLERVQPQRRHGRGIGMIEDAEHAALFSEPVVAVTGECEAVDGESIAVRAVGFVSHGRLPRSQPPAAGRLVVDRPGEARRLRRPPS